ncbi:MAG: SpoIIE family protein phosphatase [bacterium]
MPQLDYFLSKRSFFHHKDIECGDTGVIKEFDDKLFIGIVDVLGHGSEAHKLAVICQDFLEKNYRRNLIETMNALHEYIKDSRGAVVGLCLLDISSGVLQYVGVGDITARKFGVNQVKLISQDGIVGYIMKTLKEGTMRLDDGDVFVLYTDGVKEHFELEDYPELFRDDARKIATHIIQQFGKEEDDATCIAVRWKK